MTSPPTTKSVAVHWVFWEKSPRQSTSIAMATAGAAVSSATTRTRRGWEGTWEGLEPVAFEPAVHGAPAQAQRLRRFGHVAAGAGQRLLDQDLLHFLERHLVEPPARVGRRRERQVADPDLG